jgi:hypothetical protein
MSTHQIILQRLTKLGFLLMMGVSMGACSSSVTWKEEVLLHDGSKIIVKRSQSYGGRHEIGQGGSISEQDITFTLPNTNKTLTFKSEFSEDIGGINFILLALHISNGTPYIVAWPFGCLASNKWGMPNPPYVIFKHDGNEWKRIPLLELPTDFKELNLMIETKGDEKIITSQPIVSAELVRKLNGERNPPEFKSLLREPVKHEGPVGCGEMIHDGNGGWHGTGLFGKSYEACLQYCKREEFNPQNYPCETLFKGK